MKRESNTKETIAKQMLEIDVLILTRKQNQNVKVANVEMLIYHLGYS